METSDLRSGSQERAGSRQRVSLLEADPEMDRLLTGKERAAARRVMLPVHTVAREHFDIRTLLAEAGAIGVFVLEGTLFQWLKINDRLTLRLLGPGDLFIPSTELQAALPMQFGCIATAATRVALLNERALSAARRWPHMTATLLGHMAGQTERVAVQLAIAHLPRIDQRLLAIMALLAERWGQVTPDGTVIPVALTHETLGGLIGSRRSSVTVALSRLAKHGHLLKHERGWLLRHPALQPRGDASRSENPNDS
jgi:CRP/FNR family transcriptional regulator, cyclic AMP receptor protein